jgi:hypothetical protein
MYVNLSKISMSQIISNNSGIKIRIKKKLNDNLSN